jgi:drug/metabolite transporter (DMT)-like permease
VNTFRQANPTGYSASKPTLRESLVNNITLYAIVVLIWGSTWIAINFQLGTVPVEVSVAYRFGLAALALYLYAFLSRRRLTFPAHTYPIVFLQGALLFCINYFFVYYGTARITSGLVAVVFTMIVPFNAFFDRLFFGTRVDNRLAIAVVLGIAGIVMIFWSEVSTVSLKDQSVAGILLVLIGTLSASLGNMCAVRNTRQSLPVIAVNAHAMGFAAVLALALAAALGRDFAISVTFAYVTSLLYLAVFGSAIAFGCYLALIRRIGSARAAYTSLLFPVVALLISTVFEGYRWTPIATIGMLLTLGGNWLILKGKQQ